MKNIFKIFAIAAVAFTALSCVKEQEHKPGEADLEGCYGVYFPSQDNKLVLDPAEPTTHEIKVARTQSKGAITVPFEVTTSADIFKVDTEAGIKFEDGQSETVLTVDFSKSEVGTTYTFSISITDPQYASIYSANNAVFDLSVVREKWNNLGQISFISAFYWSIDVPESDKDHAAFIYQSDADKNLYRFENPFSKRYAKDFVDGDEWFTFRVLQKGDILYKGTKIETKIDKEDLIFYDDFNTGYTHSNYNEKMWLVHPSAFNSYVGDCSLWGETNKVIRDKASGKIAGVHIGCYYYLVNAGGGWNGVDEPLVVIFPGAKLSDYSIEAEAGLTSNGAVPVAFEVGADVEKIRFTVLEGTPSTAEVNKTTDALIAGTIEDATEIDAVHDDPATEDVYEYTETEISLEKTGVYTLVAVSVDAEGKGQEGTKVEFTYLADADAEEHAVVVNAGLELTERFAGEGYSKVNSMLYYIYGSKLTEVYYGLYTTAAVQQFGMDAVLADMLENGPVDADELETINGEGSSDLFTGLNPLTSYTLVVYASNGYAADIVTRTLETEGLPLEAVDTGMYTYNFWWEGYSMHVLYKDPNVTAYDSYILKNWGGDVDFKFAHEPKSGIVEVPLQPIGATHPSYGTVYVGEAKNVVSENYTGYDELPESSYDAETKTYNFGVMYFVSLGAGQVGVFGSAVETFSIGAVEPEAAPMKLSVSDLSSTASCKTTIKKAMGNCCKAGLEIAREAKAVKAEVKVKAGSRTVNKDFTKAYLIR